VRTIYTPSLECDICGTAAIWFYLWGIGFRARCGAHQLLPGYEICWEEVTKDEFLIAIIMGS